MITLLLIPFVAKHSKTSSIVLSRASKLSRIIEASSATTVLTSQIFEPGIRGSPALCRNAKPSIRQSRTRTATAPSLSSTLATSPETPIATRWSDILGYDIYLTGGMASFYATPRFMSAFMAMLDGRTSSVNQVTWCVALAERLDSRRTPRPILPAEHRSQFYLALINASKGFIYFAYSSLSHKQTWDVLRELAGQSSVLAPAVLSPEPLQHITYSTGICDPANRRFTDVEVKLFRYPDARSLLLCANSRYYPVDVKFTVSGLRGRVRRLFSKATYKVQDGAFSDRIELCGTRAYLLDLHPGTTRVEIRAEIVRHRDQAYKEDRVVVSKLRVGRRNAMVNPSFEKQTVPGYPDFTTPYRIESRPAIAEPGALFEIDPEKPFHAKYSLRLTRRSEGDGALCWGFFAISYPPRVEKPAPYVFSFYARARKPGQRIWVRLADLGEKSFPLTTKWKRYTMTGNIKLSRFRDKGVLMCPVPEGATVWVDALQMEPGTTPTPFTED